MALRTVTGKVRGLDNIEGNRVTFQVKEVTVTGDGVTYPSTVDATTGSDGEISASLIANQDYIVRFPDGSEKEIFVPRGDGSVDLDGLLLNAAQPGTKDYSAVQSAVRAALPDLVKPYIDSAAELVTQGAAGTSILSFERSPVAADGNDGDTFLNVDTGDAYRKVDGTWGTPIGNFMGPPGIGLRGDQGDSIKGDAGENNYTHVAYASDEMGTEFSRVPQQATYYAAFLITDMPADPEPEAFNGHWARIKGEAGDKGEGEPGASSYVYVRYAENAQGGGISETPQPTSTYVGFLSTDDPNPPVTADFDNLWLPFTQGTGTGGSYTPPGPLYIKLSEVGEAQLSLSMNANREHLIERDALKPIVLTDLSDGGRAVLTFIAPKVGTIQPVTLTPTPDKPLVLTSRRGYADTYLYKSYKGKVFQRDGLLDFPYDPSTSFWVDGSEIVYLFDKNNTPLANRVAAADPLTVNQGTLRDPYGVNLEGTQYLYSANWTSINFNQPFSIHMVLANLQAATDGGAPFGFCSRVDAQSYLRFNMIYGTKKLLTITCRDSAANTAIGTGTGQAISGASLELPTDLSGLTSLLFSRNVDGRFNLRCLDNGKSLEQNGTANPGGYHRGDDPALSPNYSIGMGISFGGVWRTAADGPLNGTKAYPRYLRAEQSSYSAVGAKASHNYAADWVAAIDPTGPQMVRL